MDGLAGLLDGPRARGAFLLRILLDEPWSVRLQDEAPLSVTAVVRGHLWVCPDGEEPTRLEAGDVVVWVGSDHWTIADDPATPTQIVIHPGQVCTTVDGHAVVEEMSQGVRSWGNSEVGETVLLTGVYLMEGEVTRRLLRALPRTMILRAHELDTPLIDLLGEEVVRDAPGPGGRARPAPRPPADHPAPHLVRPAPVRPARLVRRAGRPRRRPGAPADAAPPRAPVDRRRPRRPGRGLAGVVRPALHRAGGRAADGLPHRLADRARRRPAARARRHDRVGRAAGRLRDAVRA